MDNTVNFLKEMQRIALKEIFKDFSSERGAEITPNFGLTMGYKDKDIKLENQSVFLEPKTKKAEAALIKFAQEYGLTERLESRTVNKSNVKGDLQCLRYGYHGVQAVEQLIEYLQADDHFIEPSYTKGNNFAVPSLPLLSRSIRS